MMPEVTWFENEEERRKYVRGTALDVYPVKPVEVKADAEVPPRKRNRKKDKD